MAENLHEQDFNLWLDHQAIAIKNRDVTAMDWENLLDEIEDMGISTKRSLESYTVRLLEHILKIKYWDSERSRNRKHWEKECVNFRGEIKRIFRKNPSLKNYLNQEFDSLRAEAIAAESREFHVPEDFMISLEDSLEKDLELF